VSLVPSKQRNFPTHWDIVPFDEAFKDMTGGNAKVQTRDYLPHGLLPVIDQGQAPIAGYVNDRTLTCKAPIPCILFGDHTKIFKYARSPFALGADGVKVLVPKPGVDARFAFHYLQTVRLPDDLGYSRHFKYLREASVPRPSIPEQRRIADILDKADAIRRKRKEAIALTEALQRSTFQDMFGDPVTNPKGWPVKPLGQFADVRDGTHETPTYVQDGIPFVTSTHLQGDSIDFTGTRLISREDHDRFSVRSGVDDGDILFGMIGTIGSATLVRKVREFSIKNVALIKPVIAGSGPYLWALLRNERFLQQMLLNAKGGNQKFVALGPLRALPVPIPRTQLVTQFVRFLQAQMRARETASLMSRHSEQLFEALVQRLFARDDVESYRSC
jgi:type I restriction enzyme, S subunit